jgi:hypothetical protein
VRGERGTSAPRQRDFPARTGISPGKPFQILLNIYNGRDTFSRELAGAGFKRPRPPLIKMDETVRKKIDAFLAR